MMIEFVKGNLFDAEVDALVNTVNTVGVMGKGIALQFSREYPEIMKPYEDACKSGELQVGSVFTVALKTLTGPKYVINFPTKKHWKGDSKLEYIQTGLASLRSEIERLNIKSIAVPPLGCGLGGLGWSQVKNEIETVLKSLLNVRILVFEPVGKPDASKMAVVSKTPNLTTVNAALLELMRRYLSALMDDVVTLLEVHKFMYFLEEAGQPTELDYTKGTYGPYSKKLRFVLRKLEGHFITGFGDASEEPEKILQPMRGALDKAKAVLASDQGVQSRLQRVEKLIGGFETAFGMELLASVHWVAKHEEHRATTIDDAVRLIQQWNPRKKKMFAKEHIRVAWERLLANGFIGT